MLGFRRCAAGMEQGEEVFLISQLLLQPGLQLVDGHTHLLHGIPVTDGDGVVRGGLVVAHGLEVHSDAVGGSDLVLAAVALADASGVVVVHHEVLGQLGLDLPGLVAQLLGQGQDGALEGGQSGVEAAPREGSMT